MLRKAGRDHAETPSAQRKDETRIQQEGTENGKGNLRFAHRKRLKARKTERTGGASQLNYLDGWRGFAFPEFLKVL